MTKAKTFETREAWLQAAHDKLRPLFTAQALELPPINVSVGLPSVRALSDGHRRVGECWDVKASADGRHTVFISPLVHDAQEVLGILVHEDVHVCVGCKAGHKAPFKKAALALGLEGKMTETTVGPFLKAQLEVLAAELGPYPQAKFDPRKSGKKKQGTRMLKVVCTRGCSTVDDEGNKGEDVYTVRMTRKWLDAIGCPTCPSCKKTMVCEDYEPEDGDDE